MCLSIGVGVIRDLGERTILVKPLISMVGDSHTKTSPRGLAEDEAHVVTVKRSLMHGGLDAPSMSPPSMRGSRHRRREGSQDVWASGAKALGR
jgi:hypothetical protein